MSAKLTLTDALAQFMSAQAQVNTRLESAIADIRADLAASRVTPSTPAARTSDAGAKVRVNAEAPTPKAADAADPADVPTGDTLDSEAKSAWARRLVSRVTLTPSMRDSIAAIVAYRAEGADDAARAGYTSANNALWADVRAQLWPSADKREMRGNRNGVASRIAASLVGSARATARKEATNTATNTATKPKSAKRAKLASAPQADAGAHVGGNVARDATADAGVAAADAHVRELEHQAARLVERAMLAGDNPLDYLLTVKLAGADASYIRERAREMFLRLERERDEAATQRTNGKAAAK